MGFSSRTEEHAKDIKSGGEGMEGECTTAEPDLPLEIGAPKSSVWAILMEEAWKQPLSVHASGAVHSRYKSPLFPKRRRPGKTAAKQARPHLLEAHPPEGRLGSRIPQSGLNNQPSLLVDSVCSLWCGPDKLTAPQPTSTCPGDYSTRAPIRRGLDPHRRASRLAGNK